MVRWTICAIIREEQHHQRIADHGGNIADLQRAVLMRPPLSQ